MTTTSIQKWGNSQGIRLTKQILAALNWGINDEVSIVTQDNKLIIEQVHPKKHQTSDELCANFDGKYTPSGVDWGEPVGKEIW